jgi:hypothetical protein
MEQTVMRAVEALPEELRSAITLREVEGLSYEEIAQKMGCPIGTVRRGSSAREAIDAGLRPLLDIRQRHVSMHDMSDNRISEQPGPGQDKLDAHCRQQLSALIDGELSPDEARFLLRRLGHDRELSACQDRWQLAGDMLRRVPCRAAPAGFADRIAAAVGAECAKADGRSAGAPRRAAAWLRWSGGALAASVAAVALFVARQHLGGVEPEAPAPDAPR